MNIDEALSIFIKRGGLLIGICLGYQLLFEESEEFGITEENYWREHNAITEDISAGGIHFKSPLYLIEGTVLDIKLFIPIDEGVPKEINCLAKVKRVKVLGKTNVYGIAKCFLDMSTADRKILMEFIEKNAKGLK